MAYPSSVDSFAANTDGVDEVLAADMNAVQTAIENIETELGTDPAGSVADVKTRLAASLTDTGYLKLTPGTTLTISSGVITIVGNYHKVETEASAASDDLDTINGGAAGLFVRLVTVNDARDVVIKHGTGNIYCDGGKDITLSNSYEYCDLQYDTTNTRWIASVVSQHTHTESQITDLEHDAVKIDGIAVDLTGIADNETLMYDSGTSKIVKGLEVLHLTVEEADGTPTVANVVKIKVNNGTLTDDGSGVVTIDSSGAATDGAAIHDNVASEISAITEKTSLAANDMFIIEDSADSNAKKMVKASTFVSFSGCVLTKSATQAITTGTETAVSFDGEVFDTDAYHDNSTNNTRLTAPATGYYHVGGSAELLESADTKYLILRIRKGGTNANGDGRARIVFPSTTPVNPAFSRIVQLNASEYVEMTVEHNRGSNADIRETTNGTSFWIYRLA